MTRSRMTGYLLSNIGALVVLVLALTGHIGAASSSTVASLSATTTTISYQGRLTNAAGTAVSTTLPMTFRLYTVPTGGTAVWTEARTATNAVPVSGGLFNILLGSIVPVPISLLN